ncbi:MAG TPA: cyclic nucleotide-binding domain-containing protein [Gaiellaceae bacterium]|nr:cyclic nucleotide-binding domain-containing protein [Gaiellaceae bacterium]
MRIHADAKVDKLARTDMFGARSKRSLREVASLADELEVPEGTQLTVQGEQGREVFVLVDGAAEVRQDGELLRELGPGEVIGERAVLAGGPRTATVTTTEPSRVLVLTDRDFRRVAPRA